MAKRRTTASTKPTKRRKQPGTLQRVGKLKQPELGRADRDDYHYRYARGTPDRIKELEEQDYDLVTGEDSPHGGVDKTGQPYRMVAMRKRKDWHEADQREKHAANEEIIEQIKSGRPLASNADFDGHHYTPKSGININTTRGDEYEP